MKTQKDNYTDPQAILAGPGIDQAEVIPLSKFSSHIQYINKQVDVNSPLKHSSSANNTLMLPVSEYVEVERSVNDLHAIKISQGRSPAGNEGMFNDRRLSRGSAASSKNI